MKKKTSEFLPAPSTYFSHLDQILVHCGKYAHNPLSICEFRENLLKKGHTCLTGVNEMIFTRVS